MTDLRDRIAETLHTHHINLLGPEWVRCRCGLQIPRSDPYNDKPGRQHTADMVLAAIAEEIPTMGLVDHARRELELAGQTAEDPSYAATLVAAVAAFASYGHSGGSAAVAIEQLNTLLRQRTLTPLTSDPDEWVDRSHENGGEPLWQNLRDSAAMSRDGGRNWYYVDERGEPTDGGAPGNTLRGHIQRAVNANSAENGSNTPDFVLARFLTDCLDAFDRGVRKREEWYGHHCQPGKETNT